MKNWAQFTSILFELDYDRSAVYIKKGYLSAVYVCPADQGTVYNMLDGPLPFTVDAVKRVHFKG